MPRHLISIHDLTADEVSNLFVAAADIKKHPKSYASALEGKTLAMLFEKPSTRTTMGFEARRNRLVPSTRSTEPPRSSRNRDGPWSRMRGGGGGK